MEVHPSVKDTDALASFDFHFSLLILLSPIVAFAYPPTGAIPSSVIVPSIVLLRLATDFIPGVFIDF